MGQIGSKGVSGYRSSAAPVSHDVPECASKPAAVRKIDVDVEPPPNNRGSLLFVPGGTDTAYLNRRLHVDDAPQRPSPLAPLADLLKEASSESPDPAMGGVLTATYVRLTNPSTRRKEWMTHPIADASFCEAWGGCVIGGHFDGCGAGLPAWAAAQLALLAARRVLREQLPRARSSADVAWCLEEALYQGHNQILQVDEAGACTAAYYAVVEGGPGRQPLLLHVIAGDIEAYKYDARKKTWSNLAQGPHAVRFDPTETGGGIGKGFGRHEQLARGITLRYCMLGVRDDDVLLFASDGLGDTLDPVQLGTPPRLHGLPHRDWFEAAARLADAGAVIAAAKARTLQRVAGTDFAAEDRPCEALVSRLVQYAMDATSGSRAVYGQSTFQKADMVTRDSMLERARSEAEAKGQYCFAKMDHLSILAFKPRLRHHGQ